METEIDREDLLAVLNLVRPGISTKENVEQSNHFIFNTTEVLAYNDYLLISYPFDIGIKCTVDASLFLKLVSKMTSQTVSLAMNEEGTAIDIWNDKTSANLPIVIDSEIYTYIRKASEGRADNEWHALPEDFSDGLYLCVTAASEDRLTGTLCCVRIEGEDIMAGTKEAISWYQMSEKVPEDFYAEAKLLQQLTSYGTIISYTLTQGWIHFKSETDVTFSVRRVIPMELLEFRKPFKNFPEGAPRVRLPDDLLSAVETVNLVHESSEEGDKKILLTLNRDKIMCEAGTQKGTIFEEVLFDTPQDIMAPIKILIRPSFLLEVLQKTAYLFPTENRVLFKQKAFQYVAVTLKQI